MAQTIDLYNQFYFTKESKKNKDIEENQTKYAADFFGISLTRYHIKI